jgi:hypothetical protein
MELSYDDGYSFSSQSILSAAITAAELAELLHSPDTEDLDAWSDDVALPAGFQEFDAEHAA